MIDLRRADYLLRARAARATGFESLAARFERCARIKQWIESTSSMETRIENEESE